MRQQAAAPAAALGLRANWRAAAVAGLGLLWAAFVLGNYYTKLWQFALAVPQLARQPEVWAQPRHAPEVLAAASLFLGLAALAGWLLLRLALAWRRRLAARGRPRLALTIALAAAGAGLALLAGLALAPWLRPLAAQVPGDWAALPYLPQAAARALVGVSGAALVLSSAWLLGGALSRLMRWHYAHPAEQIAYSVSLGLGVFAYAGLLLAAIGLYRPLALVLLVGLGLAAGVLPISLKPPPRTAGRGRAAPDTAHLASREAPRPRAHKLWISITAAAVGMAFIAALAPEIEYDALWYHLAYPRMYLEHGALVDLPHDYVSLYPMTWELLFGYGLVLGGPVAAKLLHFATLPLTALLLHRLAQRFVPGASAWLAVALFASVPTVMWEASTAYIDLALAFHLLLALFALLHYAERPSGQWLLLAALNLGLALATKHLALVFLALCALGLFAWGLRRHRQDSNNTPRFEAPPGRNTQRHRGGAEEPRSSAQAAAGFAPGRQTPGEALHFVQGARSDAPAPTVAGRFEAPPGRNTQRHRGGAEEPQPTHSHSPRAALLQPVLVLCLAALLLPLPWYARSFLASGNPVFPELYGLFGAPPERWSAQSQAGLDAFLDAFGRPRTLANLLTLPWHMTIHGAAYHGALGPLFLILLPGLLALRRLRGAAPALALFTLGVLALWASPLASFQMRFLVPLAPLLAVLAALGAGRLLAAARAVGGPRAARLAGLGLAALLVLNLPVFTPFHERDRDGWQGWLNHVLRTLPLAVVAGAESQDAYLARSVRSYGVWARASQVLPDDARVLTWSGGDHYYTRHNRVWANATALGPIAWAPAARFEAAVAGLHGHGITHVIADRRDPPSPTTWDDFALTGPRARAELYEVLYEDRHYVLYRVKWEAWE
jgi:hypothetical protein